MSVFETITVIFDVPEWITAGLESGDYYRQGGVIRDKVTKAVVYWLKEGGAASAGTMPTGGAAAASALQVAVPVLIVAAITVAGFVHISRKIDRLEKQLDSIEGKIDAQNFALIKSGIELAAEVELLQDPENRKQQLSLAYTNLVRGSEVFGQLLKEAMERDGKELKSLPHLAAYVAGQVSAVKVDLVRQENLAAYHRAVKLRRFLLETIYHYLQCNFEAQMRTTKRGPTGIAAVLPSPLKFLFSLLFPPQSNWDYYTQRNEVLKDISGQLEASQNIQSQIETTLGAYQVYSLTPPQEIEQLQTLDEFLHGYSVECEELIPVAAG